MVPLVIKGLRSADRFCFQQDRSAILFIRAECGGFRIRRGESDREFGGPQPPILGAIDVVLSRLMLLQIWGPSLSLFVEAGAEAAVFDPVLFEGMTGGVEAGFGAVEVDLAVVSHPDFADRGD